MQLHDARTGFHDIKPLPEFRPFPWWPLVLLVAFVVICAAIWLWWRYRKRHSMQEALIVPIPPRQRTIAEIDRLESAFHNQVITLRELATGVSLALRTYLSDEFDIPAIESTNREVLTLLPPALMQELPRSTEEIRQKMFQAVRQLLLFFERVTFASHSELEFQEKSELLTKRVAETKECVERIAVELQREAERHASVVEHPPRQGSAR